jgi:predicted restriction endonuclease
MVEAKKEVEALECMNGLYNIGITILLKKAVHRIYSNWCLFCGIIFSLEDLL